MARPSRLQVQQGAATAEATEAAARAAEAKARQLRAAANTAAQRYERLLMEFNGQMTLLDSEEVRHAGKH